MIDMLALWLALAINIVVLGAKMTPAFLLWVISGFSLRVRYVDGDSQHFLYEDIVCLPGWSRNELRWAIGQRFTVSPAGSAW